MTKARKYIYDDNFCAQYHAISRVVQGAFLLGDDKTTGTNYDHRLVWLQDRLKELSVIYTVVVGGYSFMDNHFHLSLQTRPDLTEALSNREVAKRYFQLCPPKQSKKNKLTPAEWQFLEDELIANKKLIDEYRRRIGNLSEFMKSLKEPIARRANKESGKKGHFWDGRFKAILLLGHESVLTCQTYIDLNPIRADIADTPEKSKFTGAYIRIQADEAEKKLEEINKLELNGHTVHQDKSIEIEESKKLVNSANWLAPFYQGENHLRPFFKISFSDYLELLDETAREIHPHKKGYMDPTLPDIFDRLKIDRKKWVESIKNYDKWFYRIIGKMSTLWQTLKDTSNRWFKGQVHNRNLFGD